MTRIMTVAFLLLVIGLTPVTAQDRPNIVVIYADDLGYGDLSCFGHPTIRTPHLDRMAAEGMRFTQFYSAAPVCTPSRAALMTGRLPIRNGMCSNKRRVLFPDSAGGIPDSEVTVAEALSEAGYKTACIGKWHLGHLPQYLPVNHGFDYYYGIPYSNDMDRRRDSPRGRASFLNPKTEYWNIPLIRNLETIERPADQNTITRRYTEEAVKFIRKNKDRSFFVYLPHNLPHVPLFRSKEFVGHSRRGFYGDVIEEIDWSVGQVLNALRELKLDERTIVFFSSDNGPWLPYNDHGGSAGLLKDGKGSTWEGGMREPTIAWGPGRVRAGVVTAELGSTMDIFTTCITAAGGKVPDDRVVDGVDLAPVLFADGKSPRTDMFYYRGQTLMAVRLGSYKAHFLTQGRSTQNKRVRHDPPQLYNLDVDPSERFNVAGKHPEIIEAVQDLVARHEKELKAMPTQLEKRIRAKGD